MDLIGLFSTLTNSVSAYKTAVETLDEAKITAATNELQIQLMKVGAEVLSMQKDGVQATERERAALAQVHELSEKIRDLEKRRADRERYELIEPYFGTYVLRVKEACRQGEPDHYLCPHCMDNKSVKAILSFTSEAKEVGRCPECKAYYRILPAKNSGYSQRNPFFGAY